MLVLDIPGPATKGKKKPVGSVQLVRRDLKALLTRVSKTLLNIAKRFPGIH